MTEGADSPVTDLVARARRHSLGDVLHRTAGRYPDRLAVVSDSGRFTYGQFEEAVNRAAHALVDHGMDKGDRLALLSPSCWSSRSTRSSGAQPPWSTGCTSAR